MCDAKVYRIQDATEKVSLSSFKEGELKENTWTLQKFGKKMNLGHIPYHEMGEEILTRDYNEFHRQLVEHSKLLFITNANFHHHYDAMTHTDNIGWSVRAAGPEIEFFKELFKCELRHYSDPDTIEKKVYVVELPHTIRECLRQAWIIFRKRFSRER